MFREIPREIHDSIVRNGSARKNWFHRVPVYLIYTLIMKRYVVLDKKVGETPLSVLLSWKKAHAEYEGLPASYAGRLDPMASGKLLILLGEECKRQSAYTGLDKEYEVEILLDVGSDTGDALGIIEYADKETPLPARLNLAGILRVEQGRHKRAYPQYSSKTVNGKPLFMHALEGTIDAIDIPMHEERIYRTKILGTTLVESKELHTRVRELLSKAPKSDEPSKALGADFRIARVRESWEQAFEKADDRAFTLIRLRVTCGTGAYMRSLAGRLGEALETRALTLSIHRTKLGKYWNGFWLKQYS